MHNVRSETPHAIVRGKNMLIDTSATIAYKCSSCGSFEFFNISLFNILYKRGSVYCCHCQKSNITISQQHNFYLFKIPCIGCGNDHVYMLSKKDILLRDLNVFNCPETGMKLCFIGRDEPVRKKVDSLEEEYDELIDMFGYESYFKNTQVMFDSLNKIHDIAEQGNLLCECGCSEIELVPLSDRIVLKCSKCGMSKLFLAATNEDLKDITDKKQILLTDDRPELGQNIRMNYLGRMDGK